MLEKFPSTEIFQKDFKVVSLMPTTHTSASSFIYLDAAVFLQFNLYICLQPEKKTSMLAASFLQPEPSWSLVASLAPTDG